MADTFTPSGRLQLQTIGGNNNTWGTIADTQYSLIEAMITGDNGYAGGVGGIDITGLTAFTLTTNNGASDQARQQLYPFVGITPATCTVTLPGVVKMGYATNSTSGVNNVILQVSASGRKVVLPPGGGWTFFYCDGTNVVAPAVTSGPIPEYLSGFNQTTNLTFLNALDINPGIATDSTNRTTINVQSKLTKSTHGGWGPGDQNNGMGAGLVVLPNTWYAVFAINNGDVADIYFDSSTTAANAPPGTTAIRRIGMFLTDANANIIPFFNLGSLFEWNSIVNDIQIETSWTTFTATLHRTPPIFCTGIYQGFFQTSTGGACYLYRTGLLNPTGGAPTMWASVLNQPATIGRANITIDNLNQQMNVAVTSPASRLWITTLGWIDPRGQF